MAVCSTPSSPLSVAFPDDAATLLKFLLTFDAEADVDERLGRRGGRSACEGAAYVPLVMQCSAGRSLFFSKPWRTERTEGLWTSCSTNKCDCERKRCHQGSSRALFANVC